jgi:hypothetical protein
MPPSTSPDWTQSYERRVGRLARTVFSLTMAVSTSPRPQIIPNMGANPRGRLPPRASLACQHQNPQLNPPTETVTVAASIRGFPISVALFLFALHELAIPPLRRRRELHHTPVQENTSAPQAPSPRIRSRFQRLRQHPAPGRYTSRYMGRAQQTRNPRRHLIHRTDLGHAAATLHVAVVPPLPATLGTRTAGVRHSPQPPPTPDGSPN